MTARRCIASLVTIAVRGCTYPSSTSSRGVEGSAGRATTTSV